MKRYSFGTALLKGFGYVVLGNVLCLIMTMAAYMFGYHLITKILTVLFGVIIFYSLVFTAGWKDGVRQRKLRAASGAIGKTPLRWVAIGLILFVLAAAPTVFLLINKLTFPEQDNLIIYQFVSGSAYPFVIAFTPRPDSIVGTVSRVETMSVLLPSLMLAYYALIPAAAQIGFWCGYNDKPNMDKMMYK